MTRAGQLDRSVILRQRPLDDNEERSGPWAEICTRDARITPLKGGEAVQAQRMAGNQPVIVVVRRDSLTETVDNGWSVKDARTPFAVWDVQSAILTEDRDWVEIMAVQHRGGDDG